MPNSSLILFDGEETESLRPLTFLRPISELRLGIINLREKWERYLHEASWLTEPHLSKKYPAFWSADNLLVRGSLVPNKDLVAALKNLAFESTLWKDGLLLGARTNRQVSVHEVEGFEKNEYKGELIQINQLHQIFSLNDQVLIEDYKAITGGRSSQPLSSTNKVIAPENLFIEEGAIVECAFINASEGPVYIGRNAQIMEGAMLRGPLSIGQSSKVKMGAKLYGSTTIGPWCSVGGEIENSVFLGYSNKGHDGFVGNSVVAEWCNFGADSNTSNLKNDYSPVRLWNYSSKRFEKTGLQFCGLILGDHSKCGINSMFNAGTVIGVCSNIFGAGYPRNFVPSFAQGGVAGYQTHRLKAALSTAEMVMKRRNRELTEDDKIILEKVFELTQENRRF